MSYSGGTDPQTAYYGYVPSKAIGIVACVLFGLSTVVHAGQSIKYKLWWLLPTVCLSGLIELVGWAARVKSAYDPTLQTPVLIQTVLLIMAPTPLVASNFMIFSRIVARGGQQFSRLSPRRYSQIFLTADVVALIIQTLGGGMAAKAVKSGNDPKPGSHTMLAGVVFQLVSLTIYSLMGVEFLLRHHKNNPVNHAHAKAMGPTKPVFSSRVKLMLWGLAQMDIYLFTRSVYRVVELADGWFGKIHRTEIYFVILDGLMILLAMLTLNIFHPGFLLRQREDDHDPVPLHRIDVEGE
ncbi:RTA1-like protein [Stereum hirsutum FP-91666 SS1]|uniref:RTA1-like protein n=1 Tax=Stereum hirsutum (strain FP-91666) TaxID=721885 RepID=UPI000440D27D|nr:RTA1-like protein [Stereum hirsutum FP-91666 SS1]EIM86347.1 RTA1-like protein [Stereum hirsutum FP-91666 SS1]